MSIKVSAYDRCKSKTCLITISSTLNGFNMEIYHLGVTEEFSPSLNMLRKHFKAQRHWKRLHVFSLQAPYLEKGTFSIG